MLYYWVYNSAGKLITTLKQTDSTSNFGQISDTFAAGTYHVVMLAQNLTVNLGPIEFTIPQSYPGDIDLNGYDSFFESFPLTVTDSIVTQNITLQRVVGQLQVVITDTIPSNATKIGIYITPYDDILTSTGGPVEAGNIPGNYALIVALPDSVKGKSNYTLTCYVPNTSSTPFTVLIDGYNSSNTVIATATADNVTTQINTRTILSGSLFQAPQSVGFTVSIDDTWAGINIIPFSNTFTHIKDQLNNGRALN